MTDRHKTRLKAGLCRPSGAWRRCEFDERLGRLVDRLHGINADDPQGWRWLVQALADVHGYGELGSLLSVEAECLLSMTKKAKMGARLPTDTQGLMGLAAAYLRRVDGFDRAAQLGNQIDRRVEPVQHLGGLYAPVSVAFGP